MAIIDLIIKKPALKRTEVVETTAETETTATDVEPDATPDTESNSGGRLRRAVGALAVTGVGLITLRKLRSRRKRKKADADSAE